MGFKWFNRLFLAAFTASAVVQYNDPDPLAWVTVYLLGAVLCLAAMYGYRHTRILAGTLLLLTGVWALALLPQIIGQVSPSEVLESISMKTRAVEEAREIGGLALIGLWSAVVFWR